MTAVRRLTEGQGLQLIEDAVQQRLTASVRRDVVAFLSDLMDGSRPDRAAGSMAFNPLVNYPQGTVGARIKSIITGIGEGQPWADVNALLLDLQGLLGESVLTAQLLARIALVDDPATGLVTRVSDLQEVFGTTTSAAQSAIDAANAQAAAASSQAAALQAANEASVQAGEALESKTAAANSATTATTAAGNATVSADAAATSATSANGSAATATNKASVATSAATSAANSASAASSSETSAASSATSAGTSAVAANNSKVAASTSASNASLSADSAASSATNASGSASTATTKATLAANSATAAGNSATAAASSQSSAATSATAAATSATAANSSKLSAETAASNASTSASEAATSATSASGSASTATTKADLAASSASAAQGSATAAASSASVASTKAGEASSSATSASTSANTATTKAGEALSYRNDAATSASNASSSASSASTAAGAAATSSSAAAGSATAASGFASTASTRAGEAANSASAAATYYSNTVAATGTLSGQVSSLSEVVAGANGVTSQFVLKAVATRSDGKRVFGAIGVAATANNDSSGGQSEILLAADRLVFVPLSNPNAEPSAFFQVGTVNGVTTLIVPAARIGDLTVDTIKIVDGAVRASAGAQSTASVTITSTPKQIATVYVDSSGSGVWVAGEFGVQADPGAGTIVIIFELLVNGSVVKANSLSISNSTARFGSITRFVASPGSGSVRYDLQVRLLSGASLCDVLPGDSSIFVVGSRR